MSGLKVLVVGSGGREHALGWALANSASVAAVESAPGSPGLAEIGPVHAVPAVDAAGLAALTRDRGIDLVVIGPEAPLAEGVADRLRAAGLDVFGPGADAARLESSKAFAKEFMSRHGIPTARHLATTSLEEAERAVRGWGAAPVVKASGLAAGKGVAVCNTEEEALEAVRRSLSGGAFGEAGRRVVLEDRLEGEEASVFVVTDGARYHLLPGSQDHKRAFDGDRGPNTGGMGAYSPAPVLTDAVLAEVENRMVRPTLNGLREEGMDFRGLLYLGVMVTAAGPQLLEYNVRFGDPETQVVLPRWGGDLGALLAGAARGELRGGPLPAPAHGAAACVVAAAADYPASGAKGLPITGIEAARGTGALVFYAGTARTDDGLVASGGRVLNLVGTGSSLSEALDRAYEGLARVSFSGMRYRRDIGWRALERAGRPSPPGKERN